jgi:hypothetical protein
MSIQCNLEKINEFYLQNKQKIWGNAFIFKNVVYLSDRLCVDLIQCCINFDEESQYINDKWDVREPTVFENTAFPDNVGDVVFIQCPVREYAQDITAGYIITQNGSFQLTGVSGGDIDEIDPNVVSFVHNVALLFRTFQQIVSQFN